jgi:glycosyltransferase involved in cell wall biosynthesis
LVEIEIIVIDGGSKDNSINIIIKYKDHIKYWESVPDLGQSHAINKGISKCTGNIINWLACDDFLEPGSLEHISQIFNADIDVYCGVARLFNDGEFIGKKMTSAYIYSWPFTLAFGQNMQPATFWRREIFFELTPLREDLHYVMDGYMWLKYVIKYGYGRVRYDTGFIVANVDMQPEAKSVKQINKFYDEMSIVFDWLYSSCRNNKLNFNGETGNNFEFIIPEICHEFEKIVFYRDIDRLFVRTAFNKRIGIRKDVLFRLLFKNPLWLIKYYLIERKYMVNLRNTEAY